MVAVFIERMVGREIIKLLWASWFYGGRDTTLTKVTLRLSFFLSLFHGMS